MLTKGEIKTINDNNNTGTVRVPLFETSDSNDQVIIDAIFVIPPGIFNGYRPGDIVEVGFENSSLTPAVVLGRLYLGANIENQKTPNGTLCGDQLRISKYAELPVSTKLLSEKSDTVADSKTNAASFKSIGDLIIEINKLKTRILELEESKLPELEGKISELGGKVSELEEGKLPELESKITGLEDKMATLEEATLPELDDRLLALEETKLPELEGKITELEETKLPELESKISVVETKLPELEGKLTELEEVKLPELTESKVPELEGKISELDGRITELESKLPELG